MAILSNINGKFAVDSTGAIELSGSAGATNEVLVSGGAGVAASWYDIQGDLDDYLPLSGGTINWSYIYILLEYHLLVGGTLTLQGAGANRCTTFDTSANQLKIKNSAYSSASGLALRTSQNNWLYYNYMVISDLHMDF